MKGFKKPSAPKPPPAPAAPSAPALKAPPAASMMKTAAASAAQHAPSKPTAPASPGLLPTPASVVGTGLGSVLGLAEEAQGAAQQLTHADWMEAEQAASAAISFATGAFNSQCYFKDIDVMAITATGTPGCLRGPNVEQLMKTHPVWASWTGEKKELRDAICAEFGRAFDSWRSGVTVPGLPWYPAFAAWPGPQAPPTPNVPTPLNLCPSTMLAEMTKVGGAVKSKLGSKAAPFTLAIDLWNVKVQAAFQIYLASAQVMLVMGKGPVPMFAPPYIPVGPVVGGDTFEEPGALSAAPPMSVF